MTTSADTLSNQGTAHSSGTGAASQWAAPADAVLCESLALAMLRISGADATAFLQGQFTNDVAALGIGTWQYSAWCSPKGRMLANFVVVRVGDQEYQLLLHASLAESIRKRLGMFVLRAKVVVAAAPTAQCLGLGGAGAAAVLERALGAAPTGHEAVTIAGARLIQLPGPRFLLVGSDGIPSAVRDALGTAAHTAGAQAWDLLTVRAGVPVITQATTDAFVPQMANWDALGGVSFQKGCYTGQEIVARTQYLGRLKERLFLAHVESAGVGAAARVFSSAFPDQPSGTIVNAAPAPGGGNDVLAVLQTAASTSGDLHLDAPDGPPLALRALPYAVPVAATPRGRLG